jgi:hypothetical protein
MLLHQGVHSSLTPTFGGLGQSVTWTDRELAAWLDELLPAARMVEFETQLRADKALQARVAQVIRHRDQGGNSIGEVWQRGRLSCPTRSEMGGFLLGTLSEAAAAYIEFHLKTVGCRVCQANMHDLEEQSTQADHVPGRRRKFFESSAGLLRNDDDSSRFHSESNNGS